jgi:LCP family protein required for cell wall assembly
MNSEPRIDDTSQQLRPANVDADNAPRRHVGHYMGGRAAMRLQGLGATWRTGIATTNAAMPDDPRKRAPYEDPPSYRVYRAGEDRPRKSTRPAAATPAGEDRQRRSGRPGDDPIADADGPRRPVRPDSEPTYKVYTSRPRGLRARLRGEEDTELPEPDRPERRRRDQLPRERRRWRRLTWRRGLAYLGIAMVAWVLLSFVLFMISAQQQAGSISAAAQAALTPGGNMLTSANTVLILGTDQRPRTGPGSKEPGSNYSDAGSNSDTIMLWRIGGGVSRRLSIPRDTATQIAGLGVAKINAAYSFGGPALAVKTVEQFTGIRINHLIIVNLGNFAKFIDAIGGVTVKTNRVCSKISGGVSNGGFTLNLSPGTHTLSGQQALILARTRENSCNLAENDITREKRQQAILNAIKSQLISPSTFFRLPWASWAAPQAIRTDMGGFTLLSLFAASELGGSAPVQVLPHSGTEVLPNGGDALTVTPSAVSSAVRKLVAG